MSLLKLRFSSNAQLEIQILICFYGASGRQIKKKSISSLNIICFQREVNFEKKSAWAFDKSSSNIVGGGTGRDKGGQGGYAPSPRDIEDTVQFRFSDTFGLRKNCH